eukprot:TRINITY_DN30874_c0_g1_i1.p1 TRINITY_DN30874_c0_g1~~TRINITY_DN30874_c0_g1_i1.p1  ORF type:complete len:523 (+),score=92.40 TRINITY_DN30874_c0_g1_i1:64-1632(+)
MIDYDSGTWAVGFAFSLRGSVLPKALAWAIPAAGLAYILSFFFQKYRDLFGDETTFSNLGMISAGYTTTLGFLLVFRCQISYGRFWDGASYLQTIRGGWFNAVSNLVAFCSSKPERQAEVMHFQHQLVRLMSLLYSAALHSVSVENDNYEVLDLEGLDNHSLSWASVQGDRLEIIMQWIQRLIIDKQRSGVIDVAPPILSRVFQELSNGMIDVSNAKRINVFPFPFAYAQSISVLLMWHFVVAVMIGGLSMNAPWTAAAFAFMSVLSVWLVNYIAIEIEMPYGVDANDLPLHGMQKQMNDNLAMLLHSSTQLVPDMQPLGPESCKMHVYPWEIKEDGQIAEIDAKGKLTYDLGDFIEERMNSLLRRQGESVRKTAVAGQPVPGAPPVAPAAEAAAPTLDPTTPVKGAASQSQLAPGVAIATALEKHFELIAQRIDLHGLRLTTELQELSRITGDVLRVGDGWAAKLAPTAPSSRNEGGNIYCAAPQNCAGPSQIGAPWGPVEATMRACDGLRMSPVSERLRK